MNSILVVDADHLSRSVTVSALHASGFNAVEANSYFSAIEVNAAVSTNAAIIDYELPDGSGIELVKELRRNRINQRIPTIILGPCCNEVSRILSLQNGADDVLSKPISLNELILRLNNLVRAREPERGQENYLCNNGINLDMQSLQVSIGGENTDLSLSEFRLLYHFMRNPNKAFSRNELRALTKGSEAEHKLNERSIDVYVMRLRKSLQQHGYKDLIKTVRGVGYRFTT